MKKNIVMIMVFSFLFGGCKPKETIEISLDFSDIEYIEYGSEFDSQTLVKETNGEIKDYPLLDTKKVGKQVLTFQVTLEENNQSFDKEVEVKDTKKPVIELSKDKVTIEYKTQYKISDYIKSVKDEIDGDIQYKKLSDVKDQDTNYYTYQDNIKVDKAGNYKATVTAVDINGNKATKDISIIVNEQKTAVVKPTTPKTSTPEVVKPPVQESKPPVEEVKPVEPNQKDYNYVLTQTIEKTNISKKVNKIVTFTSTSYASKSGIAQYFVKENSKWVEKMKTSAIFGSQGMGVGVEGVARSPVGVYYFEEAYGVKANPGTKLRYTQINNNHYWCGEKYYNKFVDDAMTDHSDCSKDNDEHLIEYGNNYNYFASFGYNPSNTPGKGAAFFMHCKYSKSTGGCVAVDENKMIYLLNNIDTSTALIIDQVGNIQNR